MLSSSQGWKSINIEKLYVGSMAFGLRHFPSRFDLPKLVLEHIAIIFLERLFCGFL